jgi:hypothetical protein
MDKNIEWVNEQKIVRTIEALEDNNMNGYHVKNKEELIRKIEELVKKGSVVGCGGSQTLFETGIIDHLRTDRYKFLDRYEGGISPEAIVKIYKNSFFADAYFTSSNAITEEGFLYNVDGTGNRVAAMLYGPEKVIVVCGSNKIVRDLDMAVARNKQVSAPSNAKRLNRNTPCTKVGYCRDCKSSERICNEYTLIKRQGRKDRIHVIFLDEEFGY